MGSKRSHDEEEKILTQHGNKKVKKNSSSDSESSSSSIDVKLKKKLLKKLKKIKKKEKSKKKKKEKKSKSKKKEKSIERKTEPAETVNPSKSLAPMTKEEWEKQQNTLRRVYDEETGRTRLVKGTGEIVEECVSREKQLQINKQATLKDGEYFQKILSMRLK